MSNFYFNSLRLRLARGHRVRAAIAFAILLSITGCSGSALNFSSSSNVGPTGTACTPKSNPNAYDQTEKVWICKWLKPAGSSSSALTYIGHTSNNLDGLWSTTSFTTPNTSYEVTVPAAGGPWYFGVSAQKGTKVYHDYAYVVLQEEGVGNVVKFDGIKDLAAASDNFYTARWETCRDLNSNVPLNCVYSVYRVVSDSRQLFLLGTTVNLSMRVQTKGEGTEQFMVRARDSGQNDSNTILRSDSLLVGLNFPVFEGLKVAAVASGKEGLSEGTLSWNNALNLDTISGYQVFSASDRGLGAALANVFTVPVSFPAYYNQLGITSLKPIVVNNVSVPLISDPARGILVDASQTSVRIINLPSNTVTHFVVRAVRKTTSLVEENRVDRSIQTKKFEITKGFAGIIYVRRATGDANEALSMLNVGIGSVSTAAPGVHDSFLITYEKVTTCNQPFTTPFTPIVVSNPAATDYRVVGLEDGQLYKFKVQARLVNDGNGDVLLSDNVQYMCERVGANPPVFAGLTNVTPNLGPPLTSGFTRMTITFGPATGHNGFRVYATPQASTPNPLCVAREFAFNIAAVDQVVLTGLVAECSYRFQMIACYHPNSSGNCNLANPLIAGDTGPLSGRVRSTIPEWPDGNIISIVANSETSATITYATPTRIGATYDRFIVYHSDEPLPPGPKAALDGPTGEATLHSSNYYAVISNNSAMVGGTLPDPTLKWTDPNILRTPAQHCWVIQPALMVGGFPIILSKTAPLAVCKNMVVEPITQFSGAIKARRAPGAAGFSKVLVTYNQVRSNHLGAANHSFIEYTCADSDLSFPDCYGYSQAKFSTCPNAALVKRSYEPVIVTGPGETPVEVPKTVAIENALGVNNIPENKPIYCIVASINNRNAVNGVATEKFFNAGNGAGSQPVVAATDKAPDPAQGAGVTKVEAASAKAIQLTVEMPATVVDNVNGGLFSHLVVAVDRSLSNSPQTAVNLFSNLTTNGFAPGSRVSIAGRDVISTLTAALSPTGLFARSDYDILDGDQYVFRSVDTNTKSILRFQFSGGNANINGLNPTSVKSVPIYIDGLKTNEQVCVAAKVVYMDDLLPDGTNSNSHFLEKETNVVGWCVTPTAVAPLFPVAEESDDPLNPATAGIRLDSAGYALKLEVTNLATMQASFDEWHFLLPGVPPVSINQCKKTQVALFSKRPTLGQNETDDDFAERLFALTPVLDRVEMKTFNCQLSERESFFRIGADEDINPDGLFPVRYGKYFVVARAYTEASPNLSRGSRRISNDGQLAYLSPKPPSATDLVSIKTNDGPGSILGCDAGSNFTNCYDSTLPPRVPGEKYTARLTIKPPPEADAAYPKYLNKVYIWREYGDSALGVQEGDVRNNLNAKAALKANRTGPEVAPDIVIDREATFPANYSENGGTFEFLDKNVLAADSRSGFTCYLVKVVYADSDGRYLSGASTALNPVGINPSAESGNVRCVNPSYVAPTPAFGVSNIGSTIVASGTCPDGTAKLRLIINSGGLTNVNVDFFHVYYSPVPPAAANSTEIANTFRTSLPAWQVIPRDDVNFDPNSRVTGSILVGCAGKTVSSGYFHVRTTFAPSPIASTNLKYNTATYAVNSNQTNYVYVPPSITKLSYGFFMMSVEAKVTGTLGNPSVTTTEPNLLSCNNNFHNFSLGSGYQPALNGCGTFGSMGTVESNPGQIPSNVKWAQAWAACRNSSRADFRMRLPTQEEWRRANQWAADTYSDQASDSDLYPGKGCNFSGGVVGSGLSLGCQSVAQVLDGAGNMREWVDARVISQSMTAFTRTVGNPAQVRYLDAYNTAGRMLDNGIDRLTPIFRRFDAPYSAALLMGSGFSDSSPFTQQKDYNTQSWIDQDSGADLPTNAGFRCIAFSPQTIIPALGLELPEETRYAHDPVTPALGDTPTIGGVAVAKTDWTVPKNRYMRIAADNFGDYRFERISIPSSPSASGGAITITWAPWEKSCGATCSANFKYYVYRMQEPVAKDERLNPTWAVAGSRYSIGVSKPLDPLAVNSNLSSAWTPLTGGPLTASSICNGSGPYKCSYIDNLSSTDARTAWIYVIVAEDEVGNRLAPQVQRFRTPHLTGRPLYLKFNDSRQSSFRMEPRLRRVSLALLDTTLTTLGKPTQRMSWVPMHLSGLDHDYYISSYELSAYAGVVNDVSHEGPASTVGLSYFWRADASTCYERYLRTGLIDVTCNNGGTSLKVQSVPAVTPISEQDFGSYVAGCMNSNVTDADTTQNDYRMRPVTTAEQNTAGDWGDFDFNDIVDKNDFAWPTLVGSSARTYETSGGNCTEGTFTLSPAGAKIKCRSMYGVYDATTNYHERSADKYYQDYGLDNGIDGMGLAGLEKALVGQRGFNVGNNDTRWDLYNLSPTNGVNGVPNPQNPAARLDNPYTTQAGIFTSLLGGSNWYGTSYTGTFYQFYYFTYYRNNITSGRCAF